MPPVIFIPDDEAYLGRELLFAFDNLNNGTVNSRLSFAGRLARASRHCPRNSVLLYVAVMFVAGVITSARAAGQAGNCDVKADGSCKNPDRTCTGDSGLGKCTNVPNGSGGVACKCVGRCATDRGTVCANPAPPKGMVRLDVDDRNFDLRAYRDGMQAMVDQCKVTVDPPP